MVACIKFLTFGIDLTMWNGNFLRSDLSAGRLQWLWRCIVDFNRTAATMVSISINK